MKLQIIRGKEQYDASLIKPFSEQQFHDIVKFVNDLDVDEFDIYEGLYKSKNIIFHNSDQKREFDKRIELLKA